MPTRRKSLADRLRKAIKDSGLTRYRISKDTGIAYPAIHRFVEGTNSLNLENAETLMKFFKMEVSEPKKVKK